MKIVFIGGTNDGKRLDDFGGLPAIAVIKKQNPFVYHGDISSVPRLEQEEYRRETIDVSGFKFVFYVEKSLKIHDAIKQLIEGYKSNTLSHRPSEPKANEGSVS